MIIFSLNKHKIVYLKSQYDQVVFRGGFLQDVLGQQVLFKIYGRRVFILKKIKLSRCLYVKYFFFH